MHRIIGVIIGVARWLLTLQGVLSARRLMFSLGAGTCSALLSRRRTDDLSGIHPEDYRKIVNRGKYFTIGTNYEIGNFSWQWKCVFLTCNS